MEREREANLHNDLIHITGLELSDGKENYDIVLYIRRAESAFLSYCNLTEVPANADFAILEYALVLHNRDGSEGLKSESYSGISQTFETSIPEHIKMDWNKFRRLKTL